jgi:hypothetical protein
MLTGETEVLGERCPTVTLSTTTATWTGQALNQGLHGERLVSTSNCLSHGMIQILKCSQEV